MIRLSIYAQKKITNIAERNVVFVKKRRQRT